jgi:hypothetical protein
MEMVKQVDGIGELSAKEFVENIPEFMDFLHVYGLEHKLSVEIPQPEMVASVSTANQNTRHQSFLGKKVVMTKTRDKDIIEFITQNGGKLEDNIKKTRIY